MKLFPAERSEDLTAFAAAAMDSFWDAASCASSGWRASTAPSSLLAGVHRADPALHHRRQRGSCRQGRDRQAFIWRFAFTGDSAAAVEHSSHTAGRDELRHDLRAVLLLYSGSPSPTHAAHVPRGLGQEKVEVRSTVFATLGLLALRSRGGCRVCHSCLFADLPLDWLSAIPLSASKVCCSRRPSPTCSSTGLRWRRCWTRSAPPPQPYGRHRDAIS